MVPGILVILVTMVGANLAAINIVREKEIGTIEQINVTPVKNIIFILGKLIPFWVLGLVVLTIGLTIARLVMELFLQEVFLLFMFLPRYSCWRCLGLGL